MRYQQMPTKSKDDIESLLIMGESDLSDQIKQEFFQLVCVYTTEWMHDLGVK